MVVQSDVKQFAKRGKDVFARHVVSADKDIKPGEEVFVIDEKNVILAVGKAVLSGKEMLSFKKGVAVKVRRGVGEVK